MLKNINIIDVFLTQCCLVLVHNILLYVYFYTCHTLLIFSTTIIIIYYLLCNSFFFSLNLGHFQVTDHRQTTNLYSDPH